MEERIRSLYEFLNSRHLYYLDFIKYEQLLGNNKNADAIGLKGLGIVFYYERNVKNS